jgi:hypothetical protein
VTFAALIVTFAALIVTFAALIVTFAALIVTFAALIVTFAALIVRGLSVGGLGLQPVNQNIGNSGKSTKDNASAQEHGYPWRFREFWHQSNLVNDCE